MTGPAPASDPRWLPAMVGGIVLALAMIGAGSWSQLAGTPLLWLFAAPWAFVGVLLVIWGWQRRPRS
jgi:hypothetical protein